LVQIGRREPAPERELDVPEWRLITKSEIAQRRLMKRLRAVRARSKTAGKRLWIEPSDVAGAVVYLASDRARFASGSQFVIDAGLLSR
jgi:hypothetical protein